MPETVSKTAKASMKTEATPIKKREKGEHAHTCPSCNVEFSHINPICRQAGLAFSPCGNPSCLAWYVTNRVTPHRRPGRHIRKTNDLLPDIYPPELSVLAAQETECPTMDDGQHCEHWYSGGECCSCHDRAMTPQEMIDNGAVDVPSAV